MTVGDEGLRYTAGSMQVGPAARYLETLMPCSGIVLAGGRATRLGGTNKAMVDIGGRRLLDRVIDALRPLADQIIVVGHLASDFEAAGVEVIQDVFVPGSTLVAIYSGLLAARNDLALTVGCDMPFLSTAVLQRIALLSEGHDIAVPRISSYLEALHAAYRRSCLQAMRAAIERGQLKIIDLYPEVDVREVAESEIKELDPTLRSFFNVNTPEDLITARAMAGDLSIEEKPMPPVVSVVGRSDAGKTTFLEKLIPQLKARGVRVAVVKHDSHGFEMDRPGKDTWRLREAGADAVMISSPNQMAMIRRGLEREMTLDELASMVDGSVDLVLTEGYKSGDKPKVEVSRREIAGGELLCSEAELLAVVADRPHSVGVPQFGLDDAPGVAELLASYLRGLHKSAGWSQNTSP